MNQWNIPDWLEQEIRERDRVCVYCGIEMVEKVPRGGSRKNAATWEHIINDQTIITLENIARCCSSCNASKGTEKLFYCIQVTDIKKITCAEVKITDSQNDPEILKFDKTADIQQILDFIKNTEFKELNNQKISVSKKDVSVTLFRK